MATLKGAGWYKASASSGWSGVSILPLGVRSSPLERRIGNRAIPAFHTSDLKIGTLVVTLKGAGWYKVSASSGWSGVSILSLDEVASPICSLNLGVAAGRMFSTQISP